VSHIQTDRERSDRKVLSVTHSDRQGEVRQAGIECHTFRQTGRGQTGR
jgi:hypothetical protein